MYPLLHFHFCSKIFQLCALLPRSHDEVLGTDILRLENRNRFNPVTQPLIRRQFSNSNDARPRCIFEIESCTRLVSRQVCRGFDADGDIPDFLRQPSHTLSLDFIRFRNHDNNVTQKCGEPADEKYRHTRKLTPLFVEWPAMDRENNPLHACDTRGDGSQRRGFRAVEMYDIGTFFSDTPPYFEKTFYVREYGDIATEEGKFAGSESRIPQHLGKPAAFTIRNDRLELFWREVCREVIDVSLSPAPRCLRDEKQHFSAGQDVFCGLVLSHILCNNTRYVVSPQAGIRRSPHRRCHRIRAFPVGDACAALSQLAPNRSFLRAPPAVLYPLCRMGCYLFSRGSLWTAHAPFSQPARDDHSLHANGQHRFGCAFFLFYLRVWPRTENNFDSLSRCFLRPHLFVAHRTVPALAQPAAAQRGAYRFRPGCESARA